MFQLDDDSIITLTDEAGNDVDFLLLDVVEYNGSDYLVLLPLDEAEEEDDADNVLILKAENTDEGESFSGIEDEAVVNAVFELFTAQLEAAAQAEGIDDEEDESVEEE